MPGSKIIKFDPTRYFSAASLTQKRVHIQADHTFYVQGDRADSIYYLETGRARLIVVSKRGKEATIALIVAHDFLGEESLAGAAALHPATAMAIIACTALRFDRREMLTLLRQEHEFSDLFLKFVLMRAARTQEDLVDQLFNNSEKRLARTLLLMAQFGDSSAPQTLIPPITQEALAEMIGTTRSRVSYFMNRFRKLGYIEYNGRIHVHKSLLNVVLNDRLPEQRTSRPVVLDQKRTEVEKRPRAKPDLGVSSTNAIY
ncbi:cAMP-binding protein [Terriglobus roseus DSM 18391]|uniref:cAMP-binding protein n=1 Tax=Terriglobus roseus (strain DSM 18391 / NRRL B-41598 / KBS 63) TaxID=926566 RepID=I3ZIQ0_TERRK|nr:Crp/Fnr family transcriptional regulator [Terriglobus roseus]AFL89118.1 cAMP-binding protein [Terriglobus roseus DSM 18391]